MPPIQLSVFSETARLKQVVVHNPGPEVDLMVPGMMEKLLFDDILYGDLAREEHGQFRQVLAKVAEEVLDIQDMFVAALSVPGVQSAFITDLQRLVGLPDETCDHLRGLSPELAAGAIIGGLPWEDMPSHTPWEQEFDYRVRPIPNLLFMRDPASVIGDGYSVNAMATWAREREPLILSYVFRHHPRLEHHTDHDKWFDQITPMVRGEIKAPVSLEGGDILVLSSKVLVVGCSQRTQADAIQLLAESLRENRAKDSSSFDHLLMVLMPKQRSAMHLDTIFTRTSALRLNGISEEQMELVSEFFTPLAYLYHRIFELPSPLSKAFEHACDFMLESGFIPYTWKRKAGERLLRRLPWDWYLTTKY